MKARNLFYFLVLFSAFIFSGCVVRTYTMTKDRVDQDLTAGNRGYLQGEAPVSSTERSPTRTTRVFEVEFGSPSRLKSTAKSQAIETTQDEGLLSQRGYLAEEETSEISAPVAAQAIESYQVQKGDTLQKISQKFYGTTKKWARIYEANKATLKGPDKIYPGQTLNIPVESSAILKEPAENLK